MNKHNYIDKHGSKIEEGMKIRHDDGDIELVEGDFEGIGINATNPNFNGNEIPKIYPLSEFNLKEWEIVVACPDCEGDGQVKDWADDMYGNTTSFWHMCECCEGEGVVPQKDYDWIKKIYPIPNRVLREKYDKES